MVWSLYERKEEDTNEGAGLFNYTGTPLEPMKFSNGKTQETVVEEVLEEINKGKKIIFIKGVCGTGKSAIALNLAKNFKKSSIVVPIKSLQEQYEKDYTKKKFIKKDDGNPLKISVIKGRANFSCDYGGEKANDPNVPCTLEIKEKNTEALLKLIDKNPEIDREDFSAATDVRRMNIAPVCPYWSPIMPAEANPKGISDFKKRKYMSISGVEYALFMRKKGCGYYGQYNAYMDSDVLIFNSAKYLIETKLGRKPKTDIEIIDECDEFLDSFANERRVNLTRLHGALINLMPSEQEQRTKLKEMLNEINKILFDPEEIEVEKVGKSSYGKLIEMILDSPNIASEEEINYYNNVVDVVRAFENQIDKTYISVKKTKKNASQNTLFGGRAQSDEDILMIDLVSINLAGSLQELIDANNVLVMMSGTLHSEEVLRDIFGLEDFVVIEAETKNPGDIKVQRTGLERNCSYANFKNETITRKMYLKIMDLCLANSKHPTLVHVNAFKDLPSDEENAEMKFDNLITREKLREIQSRGMGNVEDFISGSQKVLFTTKCARGVDFPGDKCNSIILTKFPYPNIQGLFWKVLKKEQPEKFMEFYMDKARRDLVQKIARGVRFTGDSVELWSPDVRVINSRIK